MSSYQILKHDTLNIALRHKTSVNV